MPWNDFPLDSLTVPSTADTTEPRIYIGDDDPMLATLGQDAGMVFYYGENRAFTLSVERSGLDVGQLHLYAQGPAPDTFFQIIDFTHYVLLDELQVSIGQGYDPVTRNITTGFFCPVKFEREVTVNGSTDIVMGDGFGVPGSIHDQDGVTYLKGKRGTESVTFAAAIFHQRTVSFPVAFPAGSVPNVTVNIDSAAGTTRWWQAKADVFTETDFRLTCQTTDAARAAEAWAAVPVSWTAVVEG